MIGQEPLKIHNWLSTRPKVEVSAHLYKGLVYKCTLLKNSLRRKKTKTNRRMLICSWKCYIHGDLEYLKYKRDIESLFLFLYFLYF